MYEIKNGIFETNNDDNIYIIGDIHGDYQCLIHCLIDLCNVCNISNIFWSRFIVFFFPEFSHFMPVFLGLLGSNILNTIPVLV